MTQAAVTVSNAVFDVEKNAQFALQLFNAYYRTPDPSGKTYLDFPDFLLVKPGVLEAIGLAIHSQEKKLLSDCQSKAQARNGLVGVSKYFDEEFGYHWIKLSAYPFMLGDEIDEKKAEFFSVLNKFIDFTKNNPSVYGDLTAESETDNGIALMLSDIKKCGAKLDGKLKNYSESQLISYNPNWPAEEVKKLLAALESDDYNWNQLFLEHLRFVMRKKSGLSVVKKPSARSVDIAVPYLVQQNHSGSQLVHTRTDPMDVTQKIPIFDPQFPLQNQSVDEHSIVAVKMRALKVAKIKADAESLALQAEQEKIRLEALEVVTLRQRVADAEFAAKAAEARIEQAKLVRLAEEARAQEYELACLESEQAAFLAARQRAELAMSAKHEAEQRLHVEVDLAQREQSNLDQERELQVQLARRSLAQQQAEQTMQARIQNELEASRLAEAELVAEQTALLRSQELVEHMERRQNTDTQLGVVSYSHELVNADKLDFGSQGIAQPNGGYEQPADSANGVLLAEQAILQTEDFLVKAQGENNPFAYEEHLNAQRIAEVKQASQADADYAHVGLGMKPPSQAKTGLSLLFQVGGWCSFMLVLLYVAFAFIKPDPRLNFTALGVDVHQTVPTHISPSSSTQVIPYNPSGSDSSLILKMTSHLDSLPSR